MGIPNKSCPKTSPPNPGNIPVSGVIGGVPPPPPACPIGDGGATGEGMPVGIPSPPNPGSNPVSGVVGVSSGLV